MRRRILFLALTCWAIGTLWLIVQNRKLNAERIQMGTAWFNANQNETELSTLTWSLARGLTKDSFRLHLRLFDQRDLSYPDDSSIVLGNLTFRFDSAQKFETILHTGQW